MRRNAQSTSATVEISSDGAGVVELVEEEPNANVPNEGLKKFCDACSQTGETEVRNMDTVKVPDRYDTPPYIT